jgi:hypothetical protein
MKEPTSHFRRVSWFYLYGFPGFTRCKIIGFFPRLTGFLALPIYRYLYQGGAVLSVAEGDWAPPPGSVGVPR